MKKSIFIIFAILILSGNIFSQVWQRLNSNTIRDLEAVYFTSTSVGHVSGMGCFLKTTNAGLNWSKDTSSFPTIEFDCLHFPTQNVGYSGSYQGRVYKTFNAGANWILLPDFSPPMIPVYTIFFTTECIGFVSEQSVLIKRSSDCGFNWFNVNTQSFGAKRIFFINQQSGWATAGSNPYILKTTDGGFNWFPKPTPPLYEIWSVHFVNSLTGVAVGYTNPPVVSLILKSTDGGENWITKYNGPYGGQLTDVYICSDGFGYSVGYGGVILKTTNLGENWSRDTSGVGTHLRGIHYSGDAFYVVGASGVILKRPYSPVNIKPISSEIPNEFSLLQNYPNPFNPTTNIKFDIPITSFAKFIIYDALGREVAVLVNEELKAGTYQVDWDGSNYTSGVYFYTLQAGDFVKTKKLVLIK